MAAPANTYKSYDMVGIREDLEDVIFDVSPEETPFATACAKIKASNTYHEWQTDSLRASADNFHVEGSDTTATAQSPTTRRGNYMQILKESVQVSGTDMGLNKAGRAKEMAYALVRAGKVLKLDLEKALFDNQARDAGSAVSGRRMAGLPAWLITNVNFQNGNGGANPTGDGTDARTDDGTATAFSQTKMDSVLQTAWENGAKTDGMTCYLSAFQLDVAAGFAGNNSQRNTVEAGKISNLVDVYTTSFGKIMFKPSRECRSRDVFLVDHDMVAIASLRDMKTENLAKTGDSEKKQIVTEKTLVVRNEAGLAGIFDNTVS